MREAFAPATGIPPCLEPGQRPPIRFASLRIPASRGLALNLPSRRALRPPHLLIEYRALVADPRPGRSSNRTKGAQT